MSDLAEIQIQYPLPITFEIIIWKCYRQVYVIPFRVAIVVVI